MPSRIEHQPYEPGIQQQKQSDVSPKITQTNETLATVTADELKTKQLKQAMAIESALEKLTEESIQRMTATIESVIKTPAEIKMECDAVEKTENQLPIYHIKGDKRPYIRVQINGAESYPLLDSGAMMSLISYTDEDELLKFNSEILPSNITVTTVVQANYEITGVMWLRYDMNGESRVIQTMIVKSHKSALIVGIDFWEAFDINCMQSKNTMATQPWNSGITEQEIKPLTKTASTNAIERGSTKTSMGTGMLSMNRRVNPTVLSRVSVNLPKSSGVTYHPAITKRINSNKPVFHRYEIDMNEASDESIRETMKFESTKQAATDLIRTLLVSRPKRAIQIHELAIQPEIRTATGHDDSFEDVRRQKHTCVTEPHELTAEQQQQLEEVLKEFPYTTDSGPLNFTPIYQQSINTGNALPEMRKQYPLSPYVMKEIEKEIENLIDRDIIEPIDFSAWRWPILWVKKKTGGGRICLDARGLNKITIRDAYPTLKVDTILQNLPQAKFISCLDMTQAFHQIKIRKEDRCKTAFAIGHKFYQYKRATMGFTNSPADLAKVLDRIFGDLIPKVYHYVDDFIVLSATFEEHIGLLREVARRLRQAQLTISQKKSLFCHKKITFLGYILTEQGLQPNPERVTPIMTYKKPENVKELRRLIGLIGWYRRFIPKAAEIMAPMSDLIKGDSKKKIEWSSAADKAFEQVKEALTNAPVLSSPDYSLPYKIYTDASLTAGAAVLTQEQNGEERVIAYHSAKFSKTQSNYSATERECLAVLMGVEKFRPFIDGVEFTVVTDHASLKWLQNLKEPHGKLARWAVRLQAFNIKFEHRAGRLMTVPDALSRSIEIIEIESKEKVDDRWYNLMYNAAVTGKLHRYKVENGLLYHLSSWNTSTGERNWAMCVPNGKIKSVLEEQHDSTHFGYWKSLKNIQRLYYWPNMHQTVQDYVKSCTQCKLIKQSNENTRVPMGNYNDPKTVGRAISIDLVGPLPASKYHKHMWIIVAMDIYSRYVFVRPCTRATANNITDFLEKEVFYKFETPEEIWSDNGAQFTSKLFRDFLNEHRINHVLTPAYHPQANPVEASNKCLKTLLRNELLKRSDHTDWSSYLHKVVMKLNTTPRHPTGRSAHNIVFGKEKMQSGNEHRLIGDVNEQLGEEEMKEKREIIYEQVGEQQRAAYERNRRQYNMRAQVRTFKPGDQVYLKEQIQSSTAEAIAKKLSPLKKIMFIKEKVANSTDMYVIMDAQGKELGVYHANQIFTR